MKWKKIISTKSVLLVLLLAAVVRAVPVSATDTPIFSISGKTTMIQSNIDTSTYSDTEVMQLPDYQLVTFENVIPNNADVISLPITINGQNYVVSLTRNSFESLDDGIDSYYGSITNITNSMIFITVSGGNTIYGSIHLYNETIVIHPLKNQRSSVTTNPLHRVYSSTSLIDSDDGILFCLTSDDAFIPPPHIMEMPTITMQVVLHLTKSLSQIISNIR